MGCFCFPKRIPKLNEKQSPNGSRTTQQKKSLITLISNQDIKFQEGFHQHYQYKIDLKHVCFQNKNDWRVAHKMDDDKQLFYVNTIHGQLKQIQILKIDKCTKLRHPNIVRLVDVYEDFGQTNLVYDNFASGRLIDQYSNLQSHRERQISQISLQILSGVAYLHQNSIIHEDINSDTFVCKTPQIVQLVGYAYGGSIIPSKSKQFVSSTTVYLAPEQVKQNQPASAETNIWACGVFIYHLLTGSFPFEGKSEISTKNQISRGCFHTTSGELDRYSPECKKFLQKIFNFRPTDRPKAASLLKDEWLIKQNQLDVPIPKAVIQKFVKLKKYKKVEQASITYLIQQEYFDQLQEKLLLQFQKLDKDNSGLVSKDELVSGLIENLGQEASNQFVETIFQNFVGQTEITFEDFSSVLISRDRVLTDKELLKTYNILDKNKIGQLSIDDLFIFLSKHDLDQKTLKQILKKADINRDGWISFEEFKDLMKQVKQIKKPPSSPKQGPLFSDTRITDCNQIQIQKECHSPLLPDLEQALINFTNRPETSLLLNRYQRRKGCKL